MALKSRGTHTLGDFLNDTFSLIPRLWKRALPVSVIAILPGSALWIFSMFSTSSWFGSFASNLKDTKTFPKEFFAGLMYIILLSTMANILFFLGKSFQKAFICGQTEAILRKRDIGFAKALTASARRPWLRIAIQDAVIGALTSAITLVVLSAIIVPFILMNVNTFATFQGGRNAQISLIAWFVGIYLFSILVALVALWWLKVKTCVSAPAAVLENTNSFSGIGRSLELVRGHGFRVFGVMFVVALVISFGLGIVTGPITFAVTIPGYFAFLRETAAGSSHSMETLGALFSSLGWGIGISLLLSGVVEGTLWPTFLTLLYSDLKVRSGEDGGGEKKRSSAARARQLRSENALLFRSQRALPRRNLEKDGAQS